MVEFLIVIRLTCRLLLIYLKQIDITERGREVSLARWILRRVKVETIRVVKAALPSGGGGGGEGQKRSQRAPRQVASWERVRTAFRITPALCCVSNVCAVWGSRVIATSILAQFFGN